jgi:probable LLM family oxidoreductase
VEVGILQVGLYKRIVWGANGGRTRRFHRDLFARFGAVVWIQNKMLQCRMQIGIDSFAANAPDSVTGLTISPQLRMSNLLAEIELADKVGLDHFGLGEHHRQDFLDSAPAVILAAAAARTSRIRLTSAVTVLSAADPVRVFQEFATLDLLSGGRAEMIVGRGSFTEAFPLFGLEMDDYESLFTEKLGLLLKLRKETNPHWKGRHRPALTGQGVYPRPVQNPLPVWLGVGGTPASFARAGVLGLPLMVAIIGGQPHRFRPLVDLYRKSGIQAGHDPQSLKVGIHAVGYVATSNEKAAEDFYPGYARAFTEIGRERGWPPVTRAQFESLSDPTGALIVGDPATAIKKIQHYDESLGGISRLSFQMSVAGVAHENMLKSIEIIGGEVAPEFHR